ncbi:MAG: hypothetical protein ACFFD4_03970 [Candidatus Odinarchaeota archaeon]
MKGKITILIFCVLVTAIITTSDWLITPVAGKTATDGNDILYEAKNDILKFQLDVSEPAVSFTAGFTVTNSWQQVTVLHLPLRIEATGKINSIEVVFDLDDFSGAASFQYSHSFKLQYELAGMVALPVVVDAKNELIDFFDSHGFLYDLHVTLTFHPSPILSGWPCNLTVNPPALQTFNPVTAAELPGTGNNATGEAVLQCFPASGTYTLPSATGYRFETIFFIDCNNLKGGIQAEITVRVDSSSNHASVGRVTVTDLNSTKVLINVLSEKESYSFTTSGEDSNSKIQAFKLSIDLTGTVLPENFILKPLVTARKKPGLIIGVPGEELLFTPIPPSLHLPLMAVSVAPVGLAGYVLKKEKGKEKIVREQ